MEEKKVVWKAGSTGRDFPDKVPAQPNGNPGQRDCLVKKGRGRKTTTYCLSGGPMHGSCFELYHITTSYMLLDNSVTARHSS